MEIQNLWWLLNFSRITATEEPSSGVRGKIPCVFCSLIGSISFERSLSVKHLRSAFHPQLHFVNSVTWTGICFTTWWTSWCCFHVFCSSTHLNFVLTCAVCWQALARSSASYSPGSDQYISWLMHRAALASNWTFDGSLPSWQQCCSDVVLCHHVIIPLFTINVPLQ